MKTQEQNVAVKAIPIHLKMRCIHQNSQKKCTHFDVNTLYNAKIQGE